MPTKNHVPAKAVKVAGKPAAKKIAVAIKPVQKKVVKAASVASSNKTTPKKTVFKPAGKKAENLVAKKTVTKPSPKKPVTKSSPIKVTVKPVHKQTPRPVTNPAKPLTKKPAEKIIQAKKIAKPIAKEITKKTVPVKNIPIRVFNPAQKIMSKKDEIKSPAAKNATEKPVSAKPAAEIKAKDIKVPAPKPVVIPKISTKTVRKYQPEFTKSVLDKAQRDPGAPSQRYSDAELQEFRELIQRKLEAAKKELSYLHGLITRKDEMGGDEGDNRYMTMEDGSLSMEREQLSQMASRQITFIDHLEKAVMRIENKTYGICRITGKLIDKARLRAVPHATLSIEAKMGSGK
ncbi:MAG: TraR/DksA C4-type zinc finger protein [Ferruginibacter sp.]